MGTFLGHAAPGLFFILLSVWWIFACLNKYYISRQKKGHRYRTSVAFPCGCCCGKMKTYPIESFVKILLAIIGITGELLTCLDKNGHFIIGNAQHITMYSLFGITGVVDILLHYGVPLPQNIDFCYGIIAFVGEAYLFQFHVHIHSQLGMVMHQLLRYSIWGCILAVAAEMRWPHNVLTTLSRSFFVCLQGTWFWQIGIYLYVLKRVKITDKEEVSHMVELVVIYFCWHMVGIFLFIVTVAIFINRIHRPRDGSYLIADEEAKIDPSINDALLSDSEEEEIVTKFSNKRENGIVLSRESVGLLPMERNNN